MSRIDDLVAALCPDGVDFSELAEVAVRITDGSHNPPPASDAGQLYPMISAKNINGGHIDVKDARMLSRKDYESENKRTKVTRGDVLLTIVGAIGRVAVVRTDEPMVFQRSVCVIRPKHDRLLPDFLRFVLEATSLQRSVIGQANGAAQKGLYLGQVAKLRVPVPPLAIQREIVAILDSFTQLEAELEAELEARRRQHAYYRDELLAFSGRDVAWVPMSQVGEFIRGRRFTKDDVVPEGVGTIHYGEIYTHYGTSATEPLSRVRAELVPGLRFAHYGDVVVAAVGETVEDVGKAVAWLGEEDVAAHDDCFIFRGSLNPKFVAYHFQTSALNAEKAKYVARAKVKRLSGQSLGKLTIPVPPADEQARIVAILDRFDALVNDLSVGLPAELKARRQQYEYYRDRLLTFPEGA